MSWRKCFGQISSTCEYSFHSKLLVSLGLGGYLGWKIAPSFMYNHMNNSEENTLSKNRYYTVITSAFSEKEGIRMLFNSAIIGFFSVPIISAIGVPAFYALYFSGPIAQTLGLYYQSKNMSSYEEKLPSFTTQQAAAYSLIGFYIMRDPLNKLYLYFIPIPAIAAGALMLAFGDHKRENSAALYGAAGALFMTLLTRFRR